MVKKSARLGDYEILVDDKSRITVLKAGEVQPKSMASLREVAEKVGFDIDPKWNTQSLGSKLVDHINNNEVAISVEEPVVEKPKKSESAPVVADADGGTISKTPSEENEVQFSEEEMKEILERFAALEARLEKLEQMVNTGAPSGDKKREAIVAHKVVTSNYGFTITSYFKTSTGRILTYSGASSANRDNHNYKKLLKDVLISIGEPMEPNPEESIETFLARLRAKYNPDQTLPTLLGGYVLAADGSLGSIKPTNKNIKF